MVSAISFGWFAEFGKTLPLFNACPNRFILTNGKHPWCQGDHLYGFDQIMSKVTGRFACTTEAFSPMLNTYYQGPVLTTQNFVYFAKKSVSAKPFLVRTTFCTHQNFCKWNETSKIPSTSFGGCKNVEVRKSFVPWHSFVIGSSNFATYGLWSERDRMTSRIIRSCYFVNSIR